MTCPSCAAENEAGKRFCTECGTALAVACSSCGASLSGSEKFCGECGTPLAASTAPTAPPQPQAAPTAERRLVSVLFADLVGFTAASEQRDAEDTRELLSRYFETSRRLIELYGGTVEKFIGDAVMAVWGTPTATEDDAERAVRAALDLVASVSALGDEVGAPELRARAGVLTGEAAVTLGATGEGMVAGDLVNTAARIQSAAPPGQVYVGEITRRATEAGIVYEAAGEHELKGKSEPVELWRPLRVVAGVRGSLKSSGLEAPFVGRDREMRVVKELFHASADEGKAHLASVTGIAGIGKSRLVWEFYKYFDGVTQQINYHRGRCLAYGEGVTYWALAEMVKMRARIAEEEEHGSAVAKLRATIEEYVSDAEERKWLEPRLAQLIGLEERVATDREDLFAAWRLFFERLAEAYPTILIFEDMQWADPSLLDFVEYLLEWSRNHALFILTLARPELLERRPTWGAGKRSFTSLYLEPLRPEAMHDLIVGLVPGLPAEIETRILDRAEGVPLYAVETVRMLLDRGLLVQEGPVYVPTGPIESLEVPETLQALIAARLDGLTAEERQIVQDGAVLGKTFFKEGVARVSGLPLAEVEPALASLVRKEVLSLQADARSPDHGQYGFLQDIVKKIAYDTISKRERKAKHLAAAAFIEEAWGGEDSEIVEVLASHLLQAYEAAPAAEDGGEIKARACALLVRAGDRAAALAAAAEARHLYLQALELTDQPLQRAELLERAGRMAWRSREGDAERLLQDSLRAFEEQRQTHAAARVSAALADIESESGQLGEAVARMEAAFAVLSADEPDADVAALAAQLGRLYMLQGQLDPAAERVDFALGVAEALDLPEVFSQALNTRGGVLRQLGRHRESRILLEHALAVALEHDLHEAALRAYWNLMVLEASRERWTEVNRLIQSGLELARRAGIGQYESEFLAANVEPLVELGQWNEAAAHAEESAQLQIESESVWDLNVHASTALVCAWRGDLPGARERLGRLEPYVTSDALEMRTAFASVRATVLNAEGDHAEAQRVATAALEEGAEALGGTMNPNIRAAVVQALEAAFALGDVGAVEPLLEMFEHVPPGHSTPSVRAHGARAAARLAALRGESTGVDDGFTAAAALFRGLPAPYWLAVTLAEHGEWLVAQGRTEEAESHLTEAREIFERLEARPWLERLDSVAPTRAEVPA
jgi:class 3 adenylate cyclase/tetratricopeptide (TPR) repeat protein